MSIPLTVPNTKRQFLASACKSARSATHLPINQLCISIKDKENESANITMASKSYSESCDSIGSLKYGKIGTDFDW